MKIKGSTLKSIIRESIIRMLTESTQKLVDNFNEVAKMITLVDPNDEFYFIQLMKRWKDNKDKGMVKKQDGTYHGGAEYGNYKNGTAFKVRDAQELMALKPQIIKWCDDNNGRAYITINPRSDKDITAFAPQYKSRFRPGDARIAHADEILAGQAKENFTDDTNVVSPNNRIRAFYDIDTTDIRWYKLTLLILKAYGVPIAYTDETPSGGWHLFIDNFNLPNVKGATFYLRLFDGPLFNKIVKHFNIDAQGNIPSGAESSIMAYIKSAANNGNRHTLFPNKGKFQGVHLNIDGKRILYSNVVTAGY